MFHSDDVVAAIDMMDLAGDTSAEIAEKIHTSAAHLVDGDVTPQRRVQLVPFQNIAEIADARRR